MPNIDYQYLQLANIFAPGTFAPGFTTCVGAPTNALIGAGSPQATTWPWLILAAQHIGIYPGPAALTVLETQWRIATLQAAACTDGAGNLAATPLIGAVDPTEQVTLSYFMGSVMTAWLGINVTQGFNFMHLRRFDTTFPGVINYQAALRPDFISQAAPGSFQIWEAKARVGGGAPQPLRDGFNQTLSVASLNTPAGAVVPDAYVCCLCRLSVGNTWDIKVTDPTTPASDYNDPVFRGKLYAEYYRPFKQMIDSASPQTVSFANATFAIAPISGADATFGIDQRISSSLDKYLKQQMPPTQLADSIDSVLGSGYPSQADPTRIVNKNGVYSAAGDSWLKL